MAIHTGESVAYFPSKSNGFGHALRRRGIVRAWADVQQFYAACAFVEAPTSIEVRAFRPTEFDDDATILPVVDEALRHFGRPDEEQFQGGYMWPSGEPTKGGSHTWKRSLTQFDADLAFLIEGAPWPKATLGPIELQFTQRFRWNHPLARNGLRCEHPEADTAGGTFCLALGRRCFVQPTLSFPFVYDDPAFLDFLAAIRPHMPFRMHSSHFRASVPGKQPGVRVARKLPWPVVLT